MAVTCFLWGCGLGLMLTAGGKEDELDDASGWTIYIANDCCPDYTWGFTEEQTRQAFADIVASHLDEMSHTDAEQPGNRDRYNMAVAQEALCFVERYPNRKEELIRRIKEGRVFISPYLCNSLWGFQSLEGAIRTFYPARRLEQEWGIPVDVAEHIEEPSLPWGTAAILAGCGIRWLSSPFYAYDSTFAKLENPPIFIFEGPDGSQIRVIMDPWAANRASYVQGARLLADTKLLLEQWLPHYQWLGKSYPMKALLASGTHGDISPQSGEQTAGFAEAIRQYNTSPGPHPRLVNATLAQFCRLVDEVEERTPFLPTIRGCFGHSWDVWPVSLAKYAAGLRENERGFLGAETLVAIASYTRPDIHEATRADRERAEWCWAMLGDHAWNGTDEENRRHNADLRRRWNEELSQISQRLMRQAWEGMALTTDETYVTVFNRLSFPVADLVAVEAAEEMGGVADGEEQLPAQAVEDEGKRLLCFVSPEIGGFQLKTLQLKPGPGRVAATRRLHATAHELESPYYRLAVDPETGGVSSLIQRSSGAELVSRKTGRTLCQTVYFSGREYLLRGVKSEVTDWGPVLARLRVAGMVKDIEVTNFVTVYADLDRVDFDVRVHKPVTSEEERLCHVFPVAGEKGKLRIETPGAVTIPRPQPDGDLLPGADSKRAVVQGFVHAPAREGVGVLIAPLDSFVLRLDLDLLTFEALGNDQNYQEVVKDQDGVTDFRFRYSMRGCRGDHDTAQAVAWSRQVARPLLVAPGSLPRSPDAGKAIAVEPKRAIATCLKPADGDPSGGVIIRLWEVSGQTGPLSIGVQGYRRAVRTDLLERDLQELPIAHDEVELELRGYGFAALRLLP